MKNSIRISKVILLTAIYCFTIVIGAKSFINSDLQTTKDAVHVEYFSPASANLFYDNSQSEGSANDLNNFNTLNCKNLSNELWTITTITEQFYKTTFTQYVRLLRTFLIHLRKANLIYPFHYFW